METFSALLALCGGNSPVTGKFPSQRPVMRSFDIFFDLRLNKQSRANSRDADGLRRHRAHYDFTVDELVYALRSSILLLSQTRIRLDNVHIG